MSNFNDRGEIVNRRVYPSRGVNSLPRKPVWKKGGFWVIVFVLVIAGGAYHFLFQPNYSSPARSAPAASHPQVGTGSTPTASQDLTPLPTRDRGHVAVGQSYVTRDLEFMLERVEVAPDTINTKFYVMNRGKQPVRFDVGPEMGFFVLVDNQGRAWPPTRIDAGSVSLGPGATSGDIGPQFDGKLLSDRNVTELALTVQGILGVEPIIWRIPVNLLDSSSSGRTDPKTVLSVGETWTQQGVEIRLDRIEINADSVNTKLYVKNNTKGPLVFSAQHNSGIFKLLDNKGRAWPSVRGEDGRTYLNVGQTSGDLGPMFDGKWLVDSDVNRLTLVVSGLLGLPDAQWQFQVNARPPSPTFKNTAAGTVLTVGQPWNYDDLIMRLDRAEVGKSDLNTKFYVTNKTGGIVVFEYGPNLGYFSMVDNMGRNWPAVDTPAGRVALPPGGTSGDLGPRFEGKYLSDPEVTYAILEVRGLIGNEKASWRIDITH